LFKKLAELCSLSNQHMVNHSSGATWY